MRRNYLIQFSKTDKMKFIGHLDLLKMFQRAVKRAELPVNYSQGYNPHQLVAFALPLALGTEGEKELVEMEMGREMPPEEICARLNAVMPAHMRMMQARLMTADEKSPAASVAAARYEISVTPVTGLDEKIEALLCREEILFTKVSKKGDKVVDIRPEIFELAFENGVLNAVLAAGSMKNLRPEIATAVLGVEITSCRRMELYQKTDSGLQPVFEQHPFGGEAD